MPTRSHLDILHVEDEADHQQLFARILRKTTKPWTVDLEQADSLEEALEKFDNKEYDLIFLDLNLPDSGMEDTLNKNLQKFSETAVVVLTSLNDYEIGRRAVAAGAEDYLAKEKLDGDLLRRTITNSQERHRSKVRLEERNQELKNFAHTLAHEIRNPLQAITFALSMLKESSSEALPEPLVEMVDVASESSRHIESLISELLAFAERGKEETQIEDVRLDAVLDQIVRSLRLSNQGTKFTTDFQPNIPAFRGSVIRMRQVMENLLSNSLRYRSKDRDLHLTLDWSVKQRQEKSLCEIRLTDNGVGIHEDDLQSIFDPFFRSARTAEIEGTGLGLNFCKRVISELGGQLDVESKYGESTTFIITLPLEAISDEESAP